MVEKLRQLKEKSHMTNQQIAEKSNVPESTVARIFSGKTPNPTIATAVSMARAMGGSAADFFNEEDDGKAEEHPELSEKNQTTEATVDGLSDSFTSDAEGSATAHHKNETSASEANSSDAQFSYEKTHEEMIDFYKDALKKKDEWIARLFWCLLIIVGFILFVLVFDILHPGFGFVKY